MDQFQLHRLQAGRWFLLQAVAASGDRGLSSDLAETMLSAKLVAYDEAWCVREANYLEGKGLVRVERHAVFPPRFRLTSAGRDVLDYVVDCPDGITRPPPKAGGTAGSYGFG